MPPRLLVVLATAFAAVCPRVSAIVITDVGIVVSEDFNTLASSGTSGSALPAGWFTSESGTGADASYGVGAGTNVAGNTYSFGTAGSSDRALGGLQSGAVIPLFGVQLINGTEGQIDSLDIAYFGEQWRLGAAGRSDRLDFQYSLDATSLATGLWVDLDGLDFLAPITSSPTGALDGNLGANRVGLAATLTELSLASGASIWLRWTDFNATGSDDGLAIDDFSVMAGRTVLAPPPGTPVPDGFPTVLGLGLSLAAVFATRRRPVGCNPCCNGG